MALVRQKRSRVPTLVELAQSQSKRIIRESLRNAIWECEKMQVSSGETQINYNFPVLFEKIMSQHGAQFKIEDVNLYDYILFEPGEYKDTKMAYYNVLSEFCIRGSQLQCMYMDRDAEVYQNELFMQFMAFVMSFNIQIAVQIIQTYWSHIRYTIMGDDFDVKYMETMLTWNPTILKALFYSKDVNDARPIFSLPFISSKSGKGLTKYKMVVSVLDALDSDKPRWTSLADLTLRAHNNLVNGIIFHLTNKEDNEADHFALASILLWVVYHLPVALSGMKRRNAFATVIDHFNCPDNKEHKEFVPLIMLHVSVEDNISGMYGMTLLEYAHQKKNSIVIGFLNWHLRSN